MILERNKIGIILGRLTPAEQLQVFPAENWEEEFVLASEIGFDAIEWLIDYASWDRNPIWSKQGQKRIRQLSQRHNLAVVTVCADYIQQLPLTVSESCIRDTHVKNLIKTIESASEIGAHCVLVPCFEEYLLPSAAYSNILIEALRSVVGDAQKLGIKLGLEMNWLVESQIDLVRQIAHPALGLYYDTGNATALGSDVYSDILTIGSLLVGIHIKDRIVKGGSVLLGEGDTDFEAVFIALHQMGYKGPLILETPRGKRPADTARRHLDFIKSLQNNLVMQRSV